MGSSSAGGKRGLPLCTIIGFQLGFDLVFSIDLGMRKGLSAFSLVKVVLVQLLPYLQVDKLCAHSCPGISV